MKKLSQTYKQPLTSAT